MDTRPPPPPVAFPPAAGAAADFAVWDYTEKRAVDYLESFGDEMLNEAPVEDAVDEDMTKSLKIEYYNFDK